MEIEVKDLLGELATNVKGLKENQEKLSEWQVKKDEADKKNQEALDNLLASQKKASTEQKAKGFNEALTDAVNENFDSIKTLKKGQSVGFDLKAVADMGFANNFPSAGASVTDVRPGILALPNRKVHIRQLLPVGTLGKSVFDFVRETGGEGDLSTVNENATKPQFDLDFQEAAAPAEYIAGWLRISNKMLDDVDSLNSFLNMRLLEKYLNTEDAQLLNGNGTQPNLRGLITAATAATTATTVADVEQLMDAITQLEGSDYAATGILLNPVDFNNICKAKASTSGVYDLPQVVQIVNEQLFIYGVPVFKSTAIAANNFLVGDWGMGAQLLVREAPRVEFFAQDGTNVRENKVTVRIESRIALPIYYSGAFIKGTFSA